MLCGVIHNVGIVNNFKSFVVHSMRIRVLFIAHHTKRCHGNCQLSRAPARCKLGLKTHEKRDGRYGTIDGIPTRATSEGCCQTTVSWGLINVVKLRVYSEPSALLPCFLAIIRKYYMEVQRREEAFDQSGPLNPRGAFSSSRGVSK